MKTRVRFGVLGTGFMADRFAAALAHIQDAELTAVGSRDGNRAKEYCQRWGNIRAFTSYERLATCPQIDAVYVATHNHLHRDNMMTALQAGKHVLCEKPFTVSASEAKEVMDYAASRGLFCMEAMWTRFIPAVSTSREWIQSGKIGEVKYLKAEFSNIIRYEPGSRFFDPQLGGGALLDLGVYPLSLAYFFLGEPEDISSQAELASTGVDTQTSMTLRYRGGGLAMLAASFNTELSNALEVIGSRGQIMLEPIYCPETILLRHRKQGRPVPTLEERPLARKLKRKIRRWLPTIGERRFPLEIRGNGYNYEIIEMVRCLQKGLKESPRMPMAETIKIMEMVDRIRSQWRV